MQLVFRYVIPGLTACTLILSACGSAAPSSPSGGSTAATAPPAAAAQATTGPVATIEPAPTEAPTVAPTPEPSEEGTSRNNPLPLGTGLRFKTWAITVTSVLQGEEAAQAVAGANQYNPLAPEGFEYLLATVQIENISTEQKAQNTLLATDVRVTGERQVLYSQTSVIVSQQFEGELFPGGVAEGQIPFVVPVDEGNLMLLVNESLSFDITTRRFMAVDEGASLSFDPALAAIEPTDIGTQRNAPAKLGETVTTDNWEVTLLEAVRGEAAMALITAANQFNQPAEAGMEYIAVRVKARYIGTDKPDEAASADRSSLKITGALNKVYDIIGTVAPSPTFDATLFPGGVVEGWAILSAGAGEEGLIVIFEPLFAFDDSSTRFLAIE